MDYFGRAIRIEELDHYQTMLSITHNPYAKETFQARKLPDQFMAQKRLLESRPGSARTFHGGTRMGDLHRAFGGRVPTESVTVEEWAKRQARREAARQRARELFDSKKDGK
jgi:hypothetical protein